jgi:signal transduction histidine kinase
VRVTTQDGALALVVRDNGRGFDEAAADANRSASSLGLAGMRERIAALHGSVTLSSSQGASLTVSVPIDDR